MQREREQNTLRELRERRRLTAFQQLASWVQVPVVRPCGGKVIGPKRCRAFASGTVYHATLCEGTEAAVKVGSKLHELLVELRICMRCRFQQFWVSAMSQVLDAPLRGGFEDEVRLLSRCRHPNAAA